jgi:hypothetical protein
VDATISLPASASSVVVDVEVKNENGVVVGYTTFNPGTNAFQINQDGTLSFQIDPDGLKVSLLPNANLVAPLSSGNYTITASGRESSACGFHRDQPQSKQRHVRPLCHDGIDVCNSGRLIHSSRIFLHIRP